MTPQDLADRTAISDVVIRYATALDTRDWALLRSILMDPVHIDYTSFDPTLDKVMPADAWVDSVRQLAGFDATQHISSNHVHRLNGDRATCVSYMQAGHFLKRPDGDYHCFLHGFYTNNLVRRPEGWKIEKCTLAITASHGDSRVFEWAFSSFKNR